jgi:formylglycine-generating enzyme required for sulfatase activity
VPAFSIGKFAITQAEWVAIMEHNPSANRGNDRLPVDNVSWDDAIEFCRRLSIFIESIHVKMTDIMEGAFE